MSTTMQQVRLYGERDVRVEEVPRPTLEQPTDAIIRILGACICGSDLWPYRGLQPVDGPSPMGHEYVGVVESLGDDVTGLQVGQTVVGSFIVSEFSAPNEYFLQPTRIDGVSFVGQSQAEYLRVPHATGMLVPVPFTPDAAQLRSLLAASDVFGTAWFAAEAAQVRPGSTVVVVGDGAVGLCAVLAAREMGAKRIIAMSRHEDRQTIAREFGATDIVEERGEDGVAKIREMTGGLGAECVIEAVGMEASFRQAMHATKPGGHMGFVGVPHGVNFGADELFGLGIHLHGGPAPVRRYLPDLIERIRTGAIEPGKVFTATLPLREAAKGYQMMDERKAIKVFLDPSA